MPDDQAQLQAQLWEAITREEPNTMRDLVHKGADIAFKAEQGKTYLHRACHLVNAVEAVTLLLRFHCDPNVLDETGESSLHAGAFSGKRTVCTRLIGANSEVNAANSAGDSPLHIACRNGHDDVVSTLLSHSASVNLTNKNEDTPLTLACHNLRNDVAATLIKKGATLSLKNKDGFSAFELMEAELTKSTQNFRPLQELKDLVRRQDEKSRRAALQGEATKTAEEENTPGVKIANEAELVASSIKCGARIALAPEVFLVDSEGAPFVPSEEVSVTIEVTTTFTPHPSKAPYLEGQTTVTTVRGRATFSNIIVHACADHPYNKVRFAFQAAPGKFRKATTVSDLAVGEGEDDFRPRKATGGSSVSRGAGESMRPKSAKPGPSSSGSAVPSSSSGTVAGPSAAAAASSGGGSSGAAAAVAGGGGGPPVSKLSEVENSEQLHLFWTAVCEKDHATMNEVKTTGANLDGAAMMQGSDQGGRLFVRAGKPGNEDMVDIFLKYEMDPSVQSNNGETVLHVAVNTGSGNPTGATGPDAVKKESAGSKALLTKLSSIPMKPDPQGELWLDYTRSDGSTPLMCAVKNSDLPLVRVLVAAGASPNVPNNAKYSPLHFASTPSIAKALLDKGANIQAVTRDGQQPIHMAAVHGLKEVVEMLLERGASANAATTKGDTPLHRALTSTRIEVAKALVKGGADMTIENKAGKTALDELEVATATMPEVWKKKFATVEEDLKESKREATKEKLAANKHKSGIADSETPPVAPTPPPPAPAQPSQQDSKTKAAQVIAGSQSSAADSSPTPVAPEPQSAQSASSSSAQPASSSRRTPPAQPSFSGIDAAPTGSMVSKAELAETLQRQNDMLQRDLKSAKMKAEAAKAQCEELEFKMTNMNQRMVDMEKMVKSMQAPGATPGANPEEPSINDLINQSVAEALVSGGQSKTGDEPSIKDLIDQSVADALAASK